MQSPGNVFLALAGVKVKQSCTRVHSTIIYASRLDVNLIEYRSLRSPEAVLELDIGDISGHHAAQDFALPIRFAD